MTVKNDQRRRARRRSGSAASRRKCLIPSLDGLESRRLLTGGTINEFPITTPESQPEEITTGPDGNLWFTELQGNNVATINPTTHAIVEYPIPTSEGGPYTITTGPDGNLWFTEYYGNNIGMINPTTHAITEYPVPTANSQPLWITTGPDGDLWFTEQSGNNIGRINPTTGVITEYPVPTQSANLQVIAPGPDGNLWFTEYASDQIGRIDPSTGVITEFPAPSSISGPEGITTGPDGLLWFTAYNSDSIGTINPSTLAFANYPLPNSDDPLGAIVSGSDGNLAFTIDQNSEEESLSLTGNQIGQINPTTHAITETSIPTTDSGPNGITPGPDGNLWFVETDANQIGQLVLAPPLTATGETGFTATENTPFTSTVATFSVTNPFSTPSNFTATINWGDGSAATPGTITQSSPGGPFQVIGSHTYPFAPAPGRTITVTITDDAASIPAVPLSTQAETTATILDAPLTASPVTLDAVPNEPINATLATFTDADPLAQVSNYSTTINWGDGTSSPGTVALNTAAGTGFVVNGSHTYSAAGQYSIGVTIQDYGGSVANVISTAIVQSVIRPSFVVTNTNDSGPGSLRQAILFANQVGGHVITFAIPGTAGTVETIALATPLPIIVGPTTIDGTTQATYEQSTVTTPLIQLDGSDTTPASGGLDFGPNSAGSQLLSLSIYGFLASQVELDSSGDKIFGNDIGFAAGPIPTNLSAALVQQGSQPGADGLLIEGANETIGGVSAGQGNVISGNPGHGVEFRGSGASGSLVVGNFIGTDASGSNPLPNLDDGIVIANGAAYETIGPDNVISGNGQIGVELLTTSGNVVAGNFIGTNFSGTEAIGNGQTGVCVDKDSTNNTIGGTTGNPNVISGNNSVGVAVQGGSTNNTIQGNLIGTNLAGSAALGNGLAGVFINGSSANLVGPGNLISGNGSTSQGAGVWIDGPLSIANKVFGDSIGTDLSGSNPLPNPYDGIIIGNGASAETIGPGNVVSGNGNVGVELVATSGNVVAGNFIGTNPSGTEAIGNVQTGISVDQDSTNNTIGGAIGNANVISGNLSVGIAVQGGSTGTTIQGNLIGTNLAGSAALGNGLAGVFINGSSANLIGPGNLISGNGSTSQGAGVWIDGPLSIANKVFGDSIGTDLAGSNPLPNPYDGIIIGNGASAETIGPGNVVSGNGNVGVELVATSGNVVAGNFIGTNPSGTEAIGNVQTGISVDQGSTGNTIGGAIGNANVISGNLSVGIAVQGGSTGTTIQGNLIGTNLAGSAALGNGIAGVLISESSENLIGPGNLISGNGSISQGAGVWIDGPLSIANKVFGDFIGTDITGESAIGNSIIGVLVNQGTGNEIGGTAPGSTNLISGNTSIGVMIAQGASNLVDSNLIGTDARGIRALGNGSSTTGAGVYLDDAPGNFIGGSAVGMGNVISGNSHDGVQVFGTGSIGNLFQGNKIGTDITGKLPLGNGGNGLLVNGAPGTRIIANIIAANLMNGVMISGSASTGTSLADDAIGLGIGGQPLGNLSFGLLIANGAPEAIVVGNTNLNNTLGPIRNTTVSPADSKPIASSIASKSTVKKATKVQVKSSPFRARSLKALQNRGQSKSHR